VLREDDDDPSLGREPARSGSELPADLQWIVERLAKRRGVSQPWDRNRPRADSLGETEGHSSRSWQRKSSSAQDDDDPSPTTAFHPALGQQVDSEDDAPLGSA
jgi:hypothetical protein